MIDDLQAGKAGEYLVCADLILKGHIAFPSEQGLHYDVVMDYNSRLVRVQVKSTREPRGVPQRVSWIPSYLFQIRRMGKGGKKSYAENHVDIFALVGLDSRTIGYLHQTDARQTMMFRVRDFAGTYQNETAKVRREHMIVLRNSGMSYRDIARELSMDTSQVHRMLTGEQPVRNQGVYLDDLTLESALAKL